MSIFGVYVVLEETLASSYILEHLNHLENKTLRGGAREDLGEGEGDVVTEGAAECRERAKGAREEF